MGGRQPVMEQGCYSGGDKKEDLYDSQRHEFPVWQFSRDTLNGDSDNSSTLLPYFALPSSGDTNNDGWIDGNLNRNGTQYSPYTGQTVDASDAAILIRYIHGEDVGSSDTDADGVPDVFIHRQRTVTIGGTSKVGNSAISRQFPFKNSSWLPL